MPAPQGRAAAVRMYAFDHGRTGEGCNQDNPGIWDPRGASLEAAERVAEAHQLLCARGKWPSRRASDQLYEFPPPHGGVPSADEYSLPHPTAASFAKLAAKCLRWVMNVDFGQFAECLLTP